MVNIELEKRIKCHDEHSLFDILLYIPNIQLSSILGLRDHFGNELVMQDGLTALHDADKCSLGFVLPVLSNAFMGLLVLLLSLLELDLVDLDAVLWILEGKVDAKCIGWIDIAAFGCFNENTDFAAGE